MKWVQASMFGISAPQTLWTERSLDLWYSEFLPLSIFSAFPCKHRLDESCIISPYWDSQNACVSYLHIHDFTVFTWRWIKKFNVPIQPNFTESFDRKKCLVLRKRCILYSAWSNVSKRSHSAAYVASYSMCFGHAKEYLSRFFVISKAINE